MVHTKLEAPQAKSRTAAVGKQQGCSMWDRWVCMIDPGGGATIDTHGGGPRRAV